MNAHTVLWIYIILLVLGGLMGFSKAKSKISLIASVTFAIILSLFALNVVPFQYHWIPLLVLLAMFGSRFAKSKKFMPSGLMLILTILALALPRIF